MPCHDWRNRTGGNIYQTSEISVRHIARPAALSPSTHGTVQLRIPVRQTPIHLTLCKIMTWQLCNEIAWYVCLARVSNVSPSHVCRRLRAKGEWRPRAAFFGGSTRRSAQPKRLLRTRDISALSATTQHVLAAAQSGTHTRNTSRFLLPLALIVTKRLHRPMYGSRQLTAPPYLAVHQEITISWQLIEDLRHLAMRVNPVDERKTSDLRLLG